MKILMVASELAEVAPVGGLAEYVLGLSASLIRRGHDLRIAIPLYAYLRKQNGLCTATGQMRVNQRRGLSRDWTVIETSLSCPGPGDFHLPVYLIEGHKHFDMVMSPQEIYQWPNHEPWVVFCRAITELPDIVGWQPEIIHCNDSHTALVPVYLRRLLGCISPRTILTIHSIFDQGMGPPSLVSFAGFPSHLFSIDCFEYHGFANSLKAGLMSADHVNTVSKSCARMICRGSEYGLGLEGVLRVLNENGRLSGIINGIDEWRWRMQDVCYDGSDDDITKVLEKKRDCRRRLYSNWGWEDTGRPLIAYRARWDRQKGIELIVECIEEILQLFDVSIVTWGNFDSISEIQSSWHRLSNIRNNPQQRLVINAEGVKKYSEVITHYTASDFLLMPSNYEPCGLTQMECQRFGTIPIVRATGGLTDTVSEHISDCWPSPNGFVFEAMGRDSFINALVRAYEVYQRPELMRECIRKALLQNNSWENRVKEYENLYSFSLDESSA